MPGCGDGTGRFPDRHERHEADQRPLRPRGGRLLPLHHCRRDAEKRPLAKNYDDYKEETFISLVREHIRKGLEKAGRSYGITVSIGCCRKVPDPAGVASIQSEAEVYLGYADRAMYDEKQSVPDTRKNDGK